MSNTTNSESRGTLRLPTEDQEFSLNTLISSPGYQGSMQQILAENLGKYVECEFLIGTQNIVRKEGILYFVGISYVVLFDYNANKYYVCDFYSLKFVTFYEEGKEPVPVPLTF